MNKDLKEFYELLVKKGLKPHVTGSGPTMYIIDPTQEEINTVKELIKENYFLAYCRTK